MRALWSSLGAVGILGSALAVLDPVLNLIPWPSCC